MKISQIKARQILNSAGNFTLEIETRYQAHNGLGSAPSGTSESGAAHKQLYKNLNQTVSELNKKLPKLSQDIDFQELDDIILFEEKIKKLNLGTMPVLSVSYSILDLMSKVQERPKWQILSGKRKAEQVTPINKIIGGGEHFKNGPSIQEFLVLNKSKDILKNLQINRAVFIKAGELLGNPGFDYEHGWTPSINNEEAFKILDKAVSSVQENYKEKILTGVDVACNSIFQNGKYEGKTKDKYSSWLIDMVNKYNLYYIEDPYTEEDWVGFHEITGKLSKKLIVGDDLLATNPVRLIKANERNSCNSAIVKPNQVGSIGETIEFLELTKKFKYTPIASHRSKETNDNTVAHIALGFTPYIKMGIGGGERISKLNELIRMYE
jgi:enolase